jgi:hypothetical protein
MAFAYVPAMPPSKKPGPTLRLPATCRAPAKPPRLRFDRVVLRVEESLRTALHDAVPPKTLVAITLTAPIRLPGKTAVAIAALARSRLASRSTRGVAETVLGNSVQIRVIRRGAVRTAPLAFFVHHADDDPALLFDLIEALLTSPGRRGLPLADPEAAPWLATCRQVSAQLVGPAAVDS